MANVKCHAGWMAACDFNEYIYGPRSHWPTEEEVRDFEKKKEEEMESQRLRVERAKKGFIVDPKAKYPKGSWE